MRETNKKINEETNDTRMKITHWHLKLLLAAWWVLSFSSPQSQ